MGRGTMGRGNGREASGRERKEVGQGHAMPGWNEVTVFLTLLTRANPLSVSQLLDKHMGM